MIAVLIIDMQNAFFEDPALRSRRDDLTAACNSLMAAAAMEGAKALLVKTEHEPDRSTWTLNMLDDDQGFIFRGTDQADFVPGLQTAGVPQLVKTRDSAFFGTDLLLRLRNWGVDTTVLAGISNFRVIYASDATGSEDNAAAAAIQAIRMNEYRQRAATVAQIRNVLGNFPAS